MTHTKRKTKRKAATLLALAIALAMTTAACSNSSSNTPANQGTNNTEIPGTQEPDTAVPDNDGADNGTSGTDNNPAKPDDQQGRPVLSNEGTYNGLADSHTIEIETADGAESYQFDDDMMEKLNPLEEGDKVKFEYTEKLIEGTDSKQKWVTNIEKVE